MKKIVLAAAFVGAASTAFAGNMAEPIMPVIDVIEPTATSSSGGGLIIPLIILALVAAALAD